MKVEDYNKQMHMLYCMFSMKGFYDGLCVSMPACDLNDLVDKASCVPDILTTVDSVCDMNRFCGAWKDILAWSIIHQSENGRVREKLKKYFIARYPGHPKFNCPEDEMPKFPDIDTDVDNSEDSKRYIAGHCHYHDYKLNEKIVCKGVISGPKYNSSYGAKWMLPDISIGSNDEHAKKEDGSVITIKKPPLENVCGILGVRTDLPGIIRVEDGSIRDMDIKEFKKKWKKVVDEFLDDGEKECECGHDKHRFIDGHAKWCPKYKPLTF